MLALDDRDIRLADMVRVMAFLTKKYPRSPGYRREVGAALLKLRQGKRRKQFEEILRFHGLGLSRAYELMRLAAGTTTPEEIRRGNAARQRKSRRNKSLRQKKTRRRR
jgi:hypothetical protein